MTVLAVMLWQEKANGKRLYSSTNTNKCFVSPLSPGSGPLKSMERRSQGFVALIRGTASLL